MAFSARVEVRLPFACSEESHPPRPELYSVGMTTVEVLYRYATPPTDNVALAVARIRDVYGVRRLSFDTNARTVRVEFDATRLNSSAISKLLQAAGLDLAEELPLIPTPQPEPAPAA